MGFAAGSVTFRRFAVIGEAPAAVEQEMLDKLATHMLKEGEFGVPDEVEYGWCGGRHVFDAHFSFEHNVYADAILFALRVDTNRVPSELKKAYQIMEEEAAAAINPSGFISKKQKREVKDVVGQKLEEELRQGKFRRSKMVPVLWDLASGTVYSPASAASIEKLLELFERTFDLKLEPQSAGTLSLADLEGRGKRRDYEDFRPTRFVSGPEGDTHWPEYPWVSKGPQPKDFLGNEFLLWLWHEAEGRGGIVQTEAGVVSIVIDNSLDLDCAYGQTGRDFLKGTGPTRMPEARDALRSGKIPRKMGLVLEAGGNQFYLTFNGETFAFNGVKLPDIEEAENPRVVFEERIGLLRELCKAVDGMFHAFLKGRASSGWEAQTAAMRRWINANLVLKQAAVA